MKPCQIGIKSVVDGYTKDKDYLKFDGSNFIQILTSFTKRVSPSNYFSVAESLANMLNKKINSDIKIGNVFYNGEKDNKRGVIIAPTTKQLSLLNAKDNKEREEAIQEWEAEEHQIELEEIAERIEAERSRGDYIEEDRGEFFQKTETSSSEANPKTISIIKDFLNRTGITIETLQGIPINGVKSSADGAALIMQKLVQVVEGKETSALPEEAMHFAVEIIQQNNPKLFSKLLKEVNSYNMYKDVLRDYSSIYKTDDGKPDILKLKKEAIAKLLVEVVINKNEGITEQPELLAKTESWWQEIISFFKNLFTKSGFDQAAMDVILGKDIGELSVSEEVFYQKSSDTYDKIKQIERTIEKKEDGYYIEGKKIPRRVTDEVKDWYARKFKNNDLTKDEYDKSVDALKAEKGTAGHADFEYAFNTLVDENGYLREETLDDDGYASQISPDNRDMYDMLKQNIKERMELFPEGTRFLSEITVYNPRKNIAGTIDFIAILPNGKISVLDWKFMNLNTDKYTDIPWFKIKAWNTQMEQYKSILVANYGLRNEDFAQTRMIPILAKYSKGNKKEGILPKLLEIKVGDVVTKNITDDYLLPVGLEGEKTGNTKIDTLLSKLNADYRKFSEKSVAPEQRQEKAEHLNALFKAIRQLQMRENIEPLVYEAKLLNNRIKTTIEEYNNKYKGKDGNTFSEEEKNEFSDRLEMLQQSLNTYTDIDIYLRSLFSEDLSENDKKIREELRDTADNARNLETDLQEAIAEYASEIVVKSEGIENFLNPEKIVKGLTKLFSSTSGIQTKAIQFLYKKANKALGMAAMDTQTENKKLDVLRENYLSWAKAKNLKIKNYFDIIKKKESNELIDQFNPEFYKTLKEKIENKEVKWIMGNIQIGEYNAFLKERLEKELEWVDTKHRIGTKEEIAADIKREKSKIKQLYDTRTIDSPGWKLYDYVKLFPKESWESKEWKELNKPENTPAKNFYDYIVERNKEYRELGYINAHEARVFLPYVRKGLVEKLLVGGKARLGEQFFRSVSIDEGDIGYGRIDPHTGKPVNVIPKYFTRDIEGELSSDLFRTISFYNEAAIRYKYLIDIENQVNLILKVEQGKEAIATSMFGKTDYKDGVLQRTPDNSENSKLLQSMIESIIYGHKYIKSETFDQLLGKLGTWGNKFNEALGMDIFPEDLSDRQLSVNKTIDNLNNVFQLNILGLNMLSAGSNFFGGNTNSIINSGKYFTKRDYLAAEGKIIINKFNGEDAKKMLAALEYFLPLTDNYNRELAKKLTVNTLTPESLQDGLMILMRHSDWNVQTSNFYAYLANTIVDGGEVKNVREYLRSLPKYQNIYTKSGEARTKLKEEFEKDIKELMEEKGVLKLAVLTNGELSIPGVERKSQSVITLRRHVQQISKNALGNLTADDTRMMNMTIYGKSFMVFKNWIPRLVDVRMGNLKYNSALDAYEWGRMRMIFRVISTDLFHSIGQLKNSLIANEKGVEYMRMLYEKKKADYENDTGKVLDMTEDAFIDLVRQNIRGQIIDTVFLLSLTMLIYGLKAFQPDDEYEHDSVKSQYRFIMKATDKFRDELMYFYNPTSFSSMLSTGIFPSISLLSTFEKAGKNFFKENWALAIGDEETVEDTKVIKYWMKSFPFTNQMIGYLPMFYPEVAKDLGIRIQSNYGIR